MKTKIALGMLGFFLTLLFISCASAPAISDAPPQPPSAPQPVEAPASVSIPQYAIPDLITVRLDGDSSGFTIRNSDSRDHRVLIEFQTDRGIVRKISYPVKANDSFHWSEKNLLIRQIVIIDWI